MADQSSFLQLSRKQLILICKKLIDTGFEKDNPYDYDYDSNYNALENIAKYFSIRVSDEDVQFFSKLIHINDNLLAKIFETKDKSLYEQLVIPMAKKYKVEYQMWGHCTFVEHFEDTWTAYDKDWVHDSMRQSREDGNWDMYDGKMVDIDYDNQEVDDYKFNDVREIEEVTESTNKNKIIESLNKKTLLELRGLIDDKLRRL